MKLPHRRQFLHLAAGAAALPAMSRIARAQAYPSRPVRLVVGFPAGGAADITARLIGQWLSRAARSAGHHRKQAGWRHKYRRPGGGEFATRRLHAAFGWVSSGDQRDALSQRCPSISYAISRRSPDLSGIRWCWWRTHRSRPRRLLSSSPAPRPILARSTWRRPASARHRMWQMSCSR